MNQNEDTAGNSGIQPKLVSVPLRYFFWGIPFSLLFAVALTPTRGGANEYLRGYGFLLLCDLGYLFLGLRKNRVGYIRIATALIYLAPVIVLLFMIIAHDVFHFRYFYWLITFSILKEFAYGIFWSQKSKDKGAEPGVTANVRACHDLCSERHRSRQALPSLNFNVRQK